ncbi:hypothetical protein Tco_0970603 [Tanacetum coccineum]
MIFSPSTLFLLNIVLFYQNPIRPFSMLHLGLWLRALCRPLLRVLQFVSGCVLVDTPTTVRVFPDPILFLAGLKSSWEQGQQRPTILVGRKEMACRNYIYIEDDKDLAFLPKDPSPSFSIGSPSVSVNTEPLKPNKEPEIQPVEVTADSKGSPKPELFVIHPGSIADRIKDRKCKTREGSSRPRVKRKLAFGSSTSRATRAKTSSLKDDAPFLTVSDDDEGLLDVLELKDDTACHLKISAITPPA